MPAKNEEPMRELRLIRIFDAPRELVFKLWTEPEHLKQWWGPKGFTNPVCEFEARKGGALRIDMTAPDGTVYPLGGEVKEIVSPSRIVFTVTAHADDKGEPTLVNLNTVTLEEFDGKTKMTLEVQVQKIGPGGEDALAGMDQGWSESIERLLDLAGATAGTNERHIVATRLLNAPRTLVWKMWTDPKHIAQWWGPNGFKNTIQEMDVRPGGKWKLIMHGPDGTDYPNESVYVEVVEPQFIAFDHVAPEFRFCASFITEGAEQTRVTVRMLFPSTTLYEAVAKKFGAIEGLSQNLEKLEAHLQSMTNR